MAKEILRPHFEVSAGLIRQLGDELVSDEVTAMMELIKNSYDADSDWVRIEINTKIKCEDPNLFYKDSVPGYIIVSDNGDGMSDSDIWNNWMKISLSPKKKFKAEGKFTKKGRTPLGEKGVGRLSTNKLGNRLELFTGQIESTVYNHVAFDWETFEDDTFITSVPVHIDQLKKNANEKGTKLIITNLKDPRKWEGAMWDRFRGQISQMVFPFKEKRAFSVFLIINGEGVDLDELGKNVRKNSVVSIKFELKDRKLSLKGTVKLQKLNGSNNPDNIDFYEKSVLPDSGYELFLYLTDLTGNKKNHVDGLRFSGEKGIFYTFKRDIEFDLLDGLSIGFDSNEAMPRIAYPGDFDGEIDDFFFKDSDSVTQAFSTIAEFKRIVQNQVGIRIFRDGFGIKPYGIDGQDWLNLSGGQTSGGSFYGLRPGNVIGYVSLTARDNGALKEKTDREGFTDTPYSHNFMRCLSFVIDQVNDILEGTRRSFNEYKKQKASDSAGVKNMADSFSKLKRASENAKKIGRESQEVKFNLYNVSFKIKEQAKKQRKRNSTPEEDERNKLLAEIANLLQDADQLFGQVDNLLAETVQLDEHVKFLQPQIESLQEQLSDFAELAGLGLISEALSHELSNIVDRLVVATDGITRRLKGKTVFDASEASVFVETIRSSTKSFRKQLSHLAPSLKYVRESKEVFSIKQFTAELKEYYDERFNKGIEFCTISRGKDFNIKMNRGKLIQICDNLVINSEYWLKERLKHHPRFKPSVSMEIKEPFLRIFDNGDGVDVGIQDRIFQPFVSAKPKKVGRGLGLFIVQQLLETVDCEIILSNEKNQYGRRYIFQLNLSPIIV